VYAELASGMSVVDRGLFNNQQVITYAHDVYLAGDDPSPSLADWLSPAVTRMTMRNNNVVSPLAPASIPAPTFSH